MPNSDLLQQAITAARAGRELTARDLFLQVIQAEPNNELAWLWLVGLLDDRKERLKACQKVLEINPGNAAAQAYLNRLLAEQRQEREAEIHRAAAQFQHIQELVQAGNREEALHRLRDLVQEGFVSVEALRLLTELSPDTDEKIRALQKLVRLAPGDAAARQELQRLHHFKKNPLDLAVMHEEQGDLAKAIEIYTQAATRPDMRDQMDHIYWKIKHLENLRAENIAHVSPLVHIARLTAGPPLLYFMLMLTEMGFNPFAYFAPHLWLGFLFVLLGALMIALASFQSRNRTWLKLFKDVGTGGKSMARGSMAGAGWLLVVLSHLVLILDAYFRLRHYLAANGRGG